MRCTCIDIIIVLFILRCRRQWRCLKWELLWRSSQHFVGSHLKTINKYNYNYNYSLLFSTWMINEDECSSRCWTWTLQRQAAIETLETFQKMKERKKKKMRRRWIENLSFWILSWVVYCLEKRKKKHSRLFKSVFFFPAFINVRITCWKIIRNPFSYSMLISDRAGPAFIDPVRKNHIWNKSPKPFCELVSNFTNVDWMETRNGQPCLFAGIIKWKFSVPKDKCMYLGLGNEYMRVVSVFFFSLIVFKRI